MYIVHKPNRIPIQNMTYNYCIKCSLLKVRYSEWQSRDLRIKVNISFSKYQGKSRRNIYIEPEIFLEFWNYRLIEDKLNLDHVYENIQFC